MPIAQEQIKKSLGENWSEDDEYVLATKNWAATMVNRGYKLLVPLVGSHSGSSPKPDLFIFLKPTKETS